MTESLVGLDPDVVVSVVVACPTVDGMDAGPVGSAATFLPGRRVAGVSIDSSRVLVQVRMAWNASVDTLVVQVRSALEPIVGARRVEVVVGDIAVPEAVGDDPADSGSERGTSTMQDGERWADPKRQSIPTGGSTDPITPVGAASSSGLITPIAGEIPPPS